MDLVEKYGKKKVYIAAAIIGLIFLGVMLYFGNDVHLPYNQ